MDSIWHFIQQKISANTNMFLLYVVESIGSSPGRQGFTMAVADDSSFSGTIGGGIMEFKLVEKAKTLLRSKQSNHFIQQQFHDKEHSKNQSGMICSGSQTIAFIFLNNTNCNTINAIIANPKASILLSQNGISISNKKPVGLQYTSAQQWEYTGVVYPQSVIHIIGGGHCSLALSEIMSYLDFYIHIYDDRQQLNTLDGNSFAHEKHWINYDTIGANISIANTDFVVIMTVGYRTDKIVLQQLIHQQCYYLGLLGSMQKIDTLFAELKAEGINTTKLQQVFSPIGLPINSKTTKEIAVSIAAQIIQQKNK